MDEKKFNPTSNNAEGSILTSLFYIAIARFFRNFLNFNALLKWSKLETIIAI